MPDVSGASAVNTCVHTSLSRSAHRAAGALGTRHSPRPLIAEGGRSDAKLGRPRPRDREAMSAKQGVQPTTAFHANQSFPSTSIGLSLPLPLAGRAIAYDECPERRRRFGIVMAGLVPAIHVLRSGTKSDVDARPKAGHDDRESKSDEAKRSFAGCGRGSAAEQASVGSDYWKISRPATANPTVHGVVFDILVRGPVGAYGGLARPECPGPRWRANGRIAAPRQPCRPWRSCYIGAFHIPISFCRAAP